MTEQLRRAIAEIEQLPNDQQDAIATRHEAELQDEKAWKSRFEATTDSQWHKLTTMVQKEIRAGKTLALDELFPAKS